MAPATLAGVGMVLVVLAVRFGLAMAHTPIWLTLVGEIVAGALAYLTLAKFVARRHVDDLLGILRELLARRTTARSVGSP